MTTKDTIEGYFSNLKQKKGWESFLSDDVIFTSFTSPIRCISGKAAFLESTKPFYAMITTMEVRDLIANGDKSLRIDPIRAPAAPKTSFHQRCGRGVSCARWQDYLV
jgi:hypothetical protein